ncbi:MAG: hypothetical protein DRI44_00220 [Chlamydiae bacterium]|nr:MAG: hypothetical protein DRI44_00220 [Chlamydiota bacterium]
MRDKFKICYFIFLLLIFGQAKIAFSEENVTLETKFIGANRFLWGKGFYTHRFYNIVKFPEKLLREIDNPFYPYLFVHKDKSGNKYGVLIEPVVYKNKSGRLVTANWDFLLEDLHKIPNGYIYRPAKECHFRGIDYIPELYDDFENMLNNAKENLLTKGEINELKGILNMSRKYREEQIAGFIAGAVASYATAGGLIVSIIGSPASPPFIVLGTMLVVEACKYDETLKYEPALTEYERQMRLIDDTIGAKEEQLNIPFRSVDTNFMENKPKMTKLKIAAAISVHTLRNKTSKVKTYKYRALRSRAMRGKSYCRIILSDER